MVTDMVAVGKGIIELGFSAAAMLLVLGLLIWHQYRLAPIMTALVYSSQRLIESADALAADMQTHDKTVNGVVTTTVQYAQDTRETCLDHGKKIDDIINRLATLEGRLER